MSDLHRGCLVEIVRYFFQSTQKHAGMINSHRLSSVSVSSCPIRCYRQSLVNHFFSIFFLLPRNQQSEYFGTLRADVLAVSRGEVPSSEEISVVDSVNC